MKTGRIQPARCGSPGEEDAGSPRRWNARHSPNWRRECSSRTLPRYALSHGDDDQAR